MKHCFERMTPDIYPAIPGRGVRGFRVFRVNYQWDQFGGPHVGIDVGVSNYRFAPIDAMELMSGLETAIALAKEKHDDSLPPRGLGSGFNLEAVGANLQKIQTAVGALEALQETGFRFSLLSGKAEEAWYRFEVIDGEGTYICKSCDKPTLAVPPCCPNCKQQIAKEESDAH